MTEDPDYVINTPRERQARREAIYGGPKPSQEEIEEGERKGLSRQAYKEALDKRTRPNIYVVKSKATGRIAAEFEWETEAIDWVESRPNAHKGWMIVGDRRDDL